MIAEQQIRLDALQNTGLVLDRWIESLGQILESMTDQKPTVRWKAISGVASEVGISLDSHPASDTLWWEQPFPIVPGMTVWVSAPRSTWEYAGTATLKAAGLETLQEEEVRNTWLEILGQSLTAMGRTIGSLLSRETTCEGGLERAPSPDMSEWGSVQIGMGDVALAPLQVAFSSKLTAMLAAPPSRVDPVRAAEPAPPPVEVAAPSITSWMPAEHPRTLDLLMDVDLPLSISFGKAHLPLKEVVKLTTGSIVELNRGVSDPVEILVNQRLIARGEVVVVEGNYGVRILEIVSPQERLGSIQ